MKKNKGTGQRLWDKAKKIIPGGNQLLSKRPEMYLPDQWPAYYSKCKGCEVWDLDGNKYLDFSIMGIGACMLGYGDRDVDAAVRKTIDRGVTSTLNAPEEVELAELLCKIHPWADMVRYARSGGEAMAVAVRIARAYSGKDMIAFCGYHGWMDWYLSANLGNDKTLDGHLLPGLEPRGVPRGLSGTILPFHFNRIDELEQLTAAHGSRIGVVVMEPMKGELPKDDFLKKVRAAADKIDAVLIFDEITMGWRATEGGAHLLFDVQPDMAVYAKGMANGYAMAAILGKRAVMEAAQSTFISSTNWTERIGPSAAIAMIKKAKKVKLSDHLTRVGTQVRDIWLRQAKKHGLHIKISGVVPLSHLTFNVADKEQMLKTLFTQEMLDRGFLATTLFYASYAHKKEHLRRYEAAVDDAFAAIKDALDSGSPEKRLRGPIAHAGFARIA